MTEVTFKLVRLEPIEGCAAVGVIVPLVAYVAAVAAAVAAPVVVRPMHVDFVFVVLARVALPVGVIVA